MKFKVVKPVDVDIKYLDVYVGERVYPEDIQFGDDEFEEWDEVFEKYPLLKGNCGNGLEMYLRINVETGEVENWSKDIFGGFHTVKVVDEGTYILRDDDLNEIKKHDYCYVPNCLEIIEEGYGDYWEFVIKNGFIENWKFSQKDVDELFEIENED